MRSVGGQGGSALGPAQEQAQDELREAEPRAPLLLRQEHHPQDAREALRVPVRLRPGQAAGLLGPRAPRCPGHPAQRRGLSQAGV